jgi:hypothetical protein
MGTPKDCRLSSAVIGSTWVPGTAPAFSGMAKPRAGHVDAK